MSLKSYLVYTRPKFWPLLAIYFLVGFLFAETLSIFYFIKFVMALFSFVLLMSGILVFNSYYDKGEKETFYIKKIPKRPTYLFQFSIILKLLALIFSYFINFKLFISFFILIIVSTSYSYPGIRLKSIPILDMMANVIIVIGGLYGVYSISDKPLSINFTIFLISSFFLVLGVYPLTQIYQYKEDLKRKDKTFTIFLGKKKTLLFSMISYIAGFSILVALYYFYFGIYSSIILFLLIIYLLMMLSKWYINYKKVDEKKEMYKVFHIFILIGIYFLISLLLKVFL